MGKIIEKSHPMLYFDFIYIYITSTYKFVVNVFWKQYIPSNLYVSHPLNKKQSHIKIKSKKKEIR